VKGLNKEKYVPTVVSLSQGGYWGGEIRSLGVDVIELKRRRNREPKRLFQLVKILRKLQPDIMHTYGYSANFYGRIGALFTAIPVRIASERNTVDATTYKSRGEVITAKLLSFVTDGIICNSRTASESLVNGYSYDKRKIFTVHNGFDICRFSCETSNNGLAKRSAPKVVGTVGRLYPQKNHKLFIDIAALILDKCTDENVKFVVIGDGPLRSQLEEYAKDLDVMQGLVFYGERSDVPRLLKEIDVFVMPSLYEGISNAIMEAMFSELPVVASNVDGNTELIIDGETGYLCPVNDANAFAEKVSILLQEEDRGKEMGSKARINICNNFRVEGMVEATENIYDKLTLLKVGIGDRNTRQSI
jgi:glycosyltransferase involved in cell wall biosynthesis